MSGIYSTVRYLLAVMGTLLFLGCSPKLSNGGSSGQMNMASLGIKSTSVVLAWDKNISPEVSGYKVYINELPTEDQIGAPIAVTIDVGLTPSPDHPQYKIRGIDLSKSYLVSIRAYSYSGQESLSSNQLVLNKTVENF